MTHEHPDLPDREYARDVADVERATRSVIEFAAGAAAAMPVWFVLLLVFPALGLGVGLSLLFASLIAGGVALAVRRVFRRRRTRETTERREFRPSRGMMLTAAIGIPLVVLYLVLVMRGGG